MSEEVAATAAAVYRVAVKIPPFWIHNPALWFTQLEAQFAIANITQDETKFNYVLGNLEAKYAEEVCDVLSNPPATGKYQNLKDELIRRLSISQVKKTRQLLEHEEIGDRSPSQFLRHLRGLAGKAVPDDLLRTIWLGRLPTSMQAILATQTGTELNKVAELADTIFDTMTEKRGVAAVSREPTGSRQNEPLAEQVALLNTKIEKIVIELRQEIAAVGDQSLAHRSRERERRSVTPVRARSRSRGHGPDGVCWYHWRFRAKANRCEKPCSFQAGNDRSER